MPEPLPQPVAHAFTLVETTLMPLAAIARETGLTPQAIGKYAKALGWKRPPIVPPRHVIVARLWHSVGQTLESIEAQLKEGGVAAALREVAVLTKVMRDLATMGAQNPEAVAMVREEAEVRAEIQRRLARLRAMGSF